MRGEADLEHPEYVATIAVARLLLGADVSLQAPPNLSEPGQREQLLAAGVDDWGGVSPLTPDHVNPERPWPQLDDLAATTRAAGFRLAERLTAHPRFVRTTLAGGDTWIAPELHAAVAAPRRPRDGAGARVRGSRRTRRVSAEVRRPPTPRCGWRGSWASSSSPTAARRSTSSSTATRRCPSTC